MGPSQILLKLFLDRAGIPLQLDTFDQRFDLQKKTYLAQLTGLDMLYRFKWYLRGPYCRDLTFDAFRLKDEVAAGEDEFKKENLSPRAATLIEKAKKMWARPPDVTCSEHIWLELLASLHYLKHIAYWSSAGAKDFLAVFNELAGCKPHLKRSRVAAHAAWRRLDEFGLIRAKTLGHQ